jgi:hypothetical protein
MKFRKKPIVIDAFRLGIDEMEDWAFKLRNTVIHFDFCADGSSGCRAIIQTLEGDMIANHGDYIIKGIEGEIYPCKASIFENSYDKVSSD